MSNPAEVLFSTSNVGEDAHVEVVFSRVTTAE